MLGLLTRSPRSSAPRAARQSAELRRFRPALEKLESRYCPAGPTITLNVVMLNQRNIQLCGQVTEPGANVSGLTVTISGEATGTTTTNSNGVYSVVLQAAALGDVHAKTVDGAGQASNDAVYTLACDPPVIQNFTASQNGNIWTFTGTVVDESAPGETVTFGGISQLNGKTATVNSNGTFSLSVWLPSGLDNTVWAQDTNWWGQQSEEALYNVVS
jgi:hypothetical protein